MIINQVSVSLNCVKCFIGNLQTLVILEVVIIKVMDPFVLEDI